MKRPTQTQRILDRLIRGERITQHDCDLMHPKIQRLAARILDIKATKDSAGNFYEVAERRVTSPGGARVSEYRLVFPAGNQASLFGSPGRGRPE